jgi:hypothetical protein
MAALLIDGSALAEPKFDTCSGELTKLESGYALDFKPDQGICIFSGEDERKILAICSEGHRCEVSGIVDECKDSGECAEITHVTSVKDVTLSQQLARSKFGRAGINLKMNDYICMGRLQNAGSGKYLIEGGALSCRFIASTDVGRRILKACTVNTKCWVKGTFSVAPDTGRVVTGIVDLQQIR